MGYKKGGVVNDPITTLNNLHIKHFKTSPVYTTLPANKGTFKFEVSVSWGSFQNNPINSKQAAKTAAAQVALGAKPSSICLR
jgi:hypothetical protein